MLDNNIFRNDKGMLKSKDLKKRRNDLTEWIDYYNGDQLEDLAEAISIRFKVESTQALMIAWVAYKNVTKSIIDKISVVFQSGVNVSIAGEEMTEQSAMLSTQLKESGFFEMLPTLNSYTNLLYDMHAYPRADLDDKSVMFDLITPNITFIEQKEDFPTKASLIAYIINEQKDTNQANQVNKVAVWTPSEQYKGEMRESGEIVKDTSSVVTNQYGYIPLIHFTSNFRMNEYFSSAKQPCVDRNRDINVMLTAMFAGMSAQMLATLVITGAVEKSDIKIGPASIINLGTSSDMGQTLSADAKYITSGTDFEKIQKIIAQIEVEVALQYGISADAYRSNNSTANSGYQVKLNKLDLMKRIMDDIPLYERGLIKLVKTYMICRNTSGAFTEKWSDEFIENVRVKINPPSYETDEKETLANDLVKMALKTTSPIEMLMRDRDLSYAKAKEEYLKIQSDLALNGAELIPPTDLGSDNG